MRILYSFGIHVYGILIFIASLFYDKARELYRGQRNALKVLREKIDSQSSYVWFHAASLGEFEQGRPIIEKLKKEHP
ncbi:MAG TPA: glycosyltransferase N-terminal domain-containing protein, partial [Paludibacteraceae bacterium]|nr:glycosyltransferase N-terminal domain-containing protein [Paludibacteraceae bacterium]